MTLIKIKKTFNSQLRNQYFLILKKKKKKKRNQHFSKKKTFEINIYCFFKNGKQIMSILYLYISKISYNGIREIKGKSALIIYNFFIFMKHIKYTLN